MMPIPGPSLTAACTFVAPSGVRRTTPPRSSAVCAVWPEVRSRALRCEACRPSTLHQALGMIATGGEVWCGQRVVSTLLGALLCRLPMVLSMLWQGRQPCDFVVRSARIVCFREFSGWIEAIE
eukprot:886652-Pleurochrysis_carterae.AAC.2